MLKTVAWRALQRLEYERGKRLVRKIARPQSVLPVCDAQEGAILFFVPEAGIKPHFAAMCVLARTLQEQGHRVLVARCFGLFARCPVMDMKRQAYSMTDELRDHTCTPCAGNSIASLERYGLECLDLRALETTEIRSQVEHALIAPPNDLRHFEFDGVAFGKLCAYDLILATKILDMDHIEERHRLAWLKYIESALLSYLLVDAACKKLPIRTLVHFNDYSLLLSGRLAASKHGVQSYGVTQAYHLNVDRRRYVIVPNAMRGALVKQEKEWPNWRRYALSAELVRECADDLLAHFGAKGSQSHIFSPPQTLREGDIRLRLGLSTDRKLLVAYTSSLDEIFAAQMYSEALKLPPNDSPQPFTDQTAWLRALTQYVEQSSNLQLVVRVHPREGLKRGGVEAQHLLRLRAEFDRDLRNCLFVWPEMAVSSYDLGEAADLVLTSWSSIGLEMARLGVPVLTSTRDIGYFPDDDFLVWEERSQGYFSKLEALIGRPATLDAIAHAMRWYHLFNLGTSLSLHDVVPRSNYVGLPSFRMPAEALAIEDIIIHGTDVLDLNLERLRARQQDRSVLEEQISLKKQLRRIIHYLYVGEEPQSDHDLVLTFSDEQSAGILATSRRLTRTSEVAILMANRGFTQYFINGRVYTKYSPMCARLAPLCAQNVHAGPAIAALSAGGVACV